MKYRRPLKATRLLFAFLFSAAVLLTFAGVLPRLAVWCKIQILPALLRCLCAFSAGAAAILLVLLLLTFAAGRWYCSFLCPLGLMQDVAGFFLRRKKRKVNDLPVLRCAVAGVTAGMLAGGVHACLIWLDPYSNAGRILYPFTCGGIAALVCLILLVFWKKRIFCTSICPAGSLLGAAAKYSLFQLKIGESCVKCGKCLQICPAGCIDIGQGIVDNSRCLRCMDCISVCPVDSFSFGRITRKDLPDFSRRKFLLSAGALFAGVVAGGALLRSGILKASEKLHILPPGAGDPERFAQKCTACMLCAANCPQKIIVPTRNGTGPVRLDFSKSYCRSNCTRCSNLCPTGALQKLSLAEKRKLKIAEAHFDPRHCVVFQAGEKCGKCAEVCPTGAITLRKNGTPRPVKKSLCIGCGACTHACPVPENPAMTVSAIAKQTVIE